MRNNPINQKDLKYFQKNRKKLDSMIAQVLGPNIHLHDISEDSEGSQIEPGLILASQYGGKRANQQAFKQINATISVEKLQEYERIDKVWERAKKNILAFVNKFPDFSQIRHINQNDMVEQLLKITLSLFQNNQRELLALHKQLKEAEQKQLPEQSTNLFLKESARRQISREDERLAQEKQLIEKENAKVRNLLKLKEDSLKKEQEQSRALKIENINLRIKAKKLQKIVLMAKTLNDEFLEVYEGRKNNFRSSQYVSLDKNPHQSLHLRSNRLGIVKNRTLAQSCHKKDDLFT